MSQTAVNRLMDQAIPGMKADIGPDKVVTYRAEGAALDIGIGLVEGTAFTDVIKPINAASQIFKGFSAQSHDRENLVVGVNNAVYKENAPVNTFTFGSIWVFFSATPSPGDAVLIAVDAGNEGKVTDTAAANTVAATGWRFVEIDAVTGLAKITNVGS